MEKDYYEIMGVPHSASQEEIKESFKRLVKEYHPDKHANNPLAHLAEQMMKKINEAYGVLGDPGKRTRYDQYLSGHTAEHQQYASTGESDLRQGHVACAYHHDIAASALCPFCNKPLCASCATMFSILACPDCLEKKNRQYLKDIRRPLVGTVISALVGFVLFGFRWESALIFVILYWGWREFKIALGSSLLAGAFGGFFGMGISLIAGVFISAFAGAFKGLVSIPKLTYLYITERKKVKDAETFILRFKAHVSTN